MTGDRRGFALVAVLLVLAILGVVGAEFSYSMRLEATAARAWKEGIVAGHLAEAAVEQAIREFAADAPYVGLGEEGDLTFYTTQRVALPRLPRTAVPLGPGQFSYRLQDEQARLNLNTTPPDRLDRLLAGLGLDKRDRDVVIDSLQDWRDANDEHRLNGAESEDYYLKLAVPYRARNGNLQSTAELQQIRGVTAVLFHGAQGRPGLADLVTVRTPGQVNINTAPPAILRAIGLSEAEIIDVEQSRRLSPYATVPGRFTGRGLVAATRTLRVEAEGLVEGRVRARLTAVLSKRGSPGNSVIQVVEWSGVQ